MMYLWQNYSVDNEFHVDPTPLSPYLEISSVVDKKIGVNTMLRFHEIFAPLFIDNSYFDNPRGSFENCLLHYLAQLDLNSGLHRVSFAEHALDDELRAGHYGREAAELYSTLNDNERRLLQIFLQRHNAAQGLKSYFFDALEQFFPQTQSYFHEFEQKFLICIPAPETEHNCRLMELLMRLLLDMDATAEIFWNSRFGLIGVRETMLLDEFVIY